MNPNVFIFFGPSGCGKGTQAKLLLDYLKLNGKETLLIETGNTFRAFIKTGNYAAKIIKETMESGGLPCAFFPIWMWSDIIIKNFTGKQELIFDGACRRLEEAEVLFSVFDFFKLNKINFILLKLSNESIVNRLSLRNRIDDISIEKINNRLEWYKEQSVKIIDYFQSKPTVRFIEIDGERSIEEIHKSIIEKLQI